MTMPWLQYFGVVGFCLVAAMFAIDVEPPAVAPPADPPADYGIRIVSKKVGPEAEIFSGQSVDYGVRFPLEIVDGERSGAMRASAASAALVDVQASAKKRTGK